MPGTNGVGGSTGVDYGNTVFTDKKDQNITADDFLQLMVAQLKNQDFMNPVDDTQYVTQLAQFATMQQMQELAANAKQSYVLSLVGQTVTAAKFKVNGDIDSVTGPIDKISLVDNEYLLYVGDKTFTLDQIMELHAPPEPEKTKPEDETDYSQSNFLLSLIGREVTVVDDDDIEITGEVERVSMSDGFEFMIDGEWYTLDQLKTVRPGSKDEDVQDPDISAPDPVNPDPADPDPVNPDPPVDNSGEAGDVTGPDATDPNPPVENPDASETAGEGEQEEISVPEMGEGTTPPEDTDSSEDFVVTPEA